MPIEHTTCEGSNARPTFGQRCPVCGAQVRVYRDREGRSTVYPHKQEGQP